MLRAYLFFQLLVAAFFVPAAVFYEDFHSAPDLSEGWSYVETRNVELGKFNAAASVDNKTACEGETNSLKIAKSTSSEDVRLEILSPFSEVPLRQVSLCIKRTGTGDPSSDALSICGQTGTDGEWRTLTGPSPVSTTKQWITNGIPAAENVNRVKFVFTASADSCKNCSLDSLRVSDVAIDEPAGQKSPLAVGPDCATFNFEEDFSCFAGIVKATPLKDISVRGLQCFRSGVAQDELNYTSEVNATKSGCYVFSGTERSADSYLIGSLASGDNDCVFGYAFSNAFEKAIHGVVIRFDSVQRSFKANPSAYIFEYCVTDGAWAINRTSGWTEVQIPPTAPHTSATWTDQSEYWQRDVTVKLEFKSTFAPGKVLLLRWRHPKTTNGPMMGVDNVRLAFRNPIGMAVRVK